MRGRIVVAQATVHGMAATALFQAAGRAASGVQAPLLVLVCDQDQTSLAEPAARAAGARASR